jgi:hypothetical protein
MMSPVLGITFTEGVNPVDDTPKSTRCSMQALVYRYSVQGDRATTTTTAVDSSEYRIPIQMKSKP